MNVCDSCRESDENLELVPIDAAITTSGGVAVYKGNALLCENCLTELADSIKTPVMVRSEPPKDFAAPTAKPATTPVSEPDPETQQAPIDPETDSEVTPEGATTESEPETDVVSEETAEPGTEQVPVIETQETENVAESS